MIHARQSRKSSITQHVLAGYLAELSDAEFLRELSSVFSGGPVGIVIAARLLHISMKCDANEEASE